MRFKKSDNADAIVGQLRGLSSALTLSSERMKELAQEVAATRMAVLSDASSRAQREFESEVNSAHLQNSLALTLEYHKKMQAIGTGIMQACVIANTGALVVLLTLIKDTFKQGFPLDARAIIVAASLFTAGMCIGLLGALVAYFASRFGTRRAVFEALRFNVERSNGFVGELGRFSPETPVGARIAGRKVASRFENLSPLQYVDFFIAHYSKRARRLEGVSIVAVVISALLLMGGIGLSFFGLLDAVEKPPLPKPSQTSTSMHPHSPHTSSNGIVGTALGLRRWRAE
jgi:hypothetical protein